MPATSPLPESENQQIAELVSRVPADTGDLATGDFLGDLDVAIIDRHVRELRDIEAARARIQGGTFGTCVDCGGEIALARLNAYPTAKRCLTCQQKREQVYAHEQTPRF